MNSENGTNRSLKDLPAENQFSDQVLSTLMFPSTLIGYASDRSPLAREH